MPDLRFTATQTRKLNLFRPFYQIPGIVKFIVKRQRHYLGLTLLALVDIILAIGLVTNASFFSQAVDRVVLLEELQTFSSQTGRPPFSTQIYVFPSSRKPIKLETAENLSKNIAGTLASEVGLPVRQMSIEVTSGSLMLSPAQDSTLFSQGNNFLGNVEAVYLTDVAPQMEMVDGIPLDENGSSKDVLDIWMYDSQAQQMGVHVNEKLRLGISLQDAIPIRVAGIWKAKDPKSDYWFTDPDMTFSDSFLVRRNDYIHFIQPRVASATGEAAWYVILDENKLTPSQSQRYLNGFVRAGDLIAKFLPGSRMNTPPLDPLTKFIQRSNAMTVLLLGYNLPAFAILIYFLILTSTIIAQWQRRETVMLVGRGMSASGILGLTFIEQIMLILVGYPLGVAFGMTIARAMGYTRSFLSFTSRAPLPVSLEGLSIPLTLVALAFALFARLIPAYRAARSSLVMEERERARPMNKPFWYKAYLDIILLIPTYYAYDQMAKRGSLAGLIISKPEDLYRDPLLIVVPALFILTVSLVTMRLFALLMRLIDLVADKIPWLTIHLALRQLGRQSLDYVQPLLLVIVSLSMGVYTLSMAASLDQWTTDRMYYKSGADLTFTPKPASGDQSSGDGGWIPLPSDFEKIPGVEGATRVGNFEVRLNADTPNQLIADFMAVDRAEFASVAWFRDDFASESLGALMNRLAAVPEGVLVSSQFLTANNLNIGDTLSATISIDTLMNADTEFTIVGVYDYFPTVYDDSVTLIGNLDYISTLTGLTAPHDIWLKLKPGVASSSVFKDIAAILGVKPDPTKVNDTQELIAEEQGRMERVGIFGTLTVGFLATALMAILGLLIYSYASLQERAYRLAVLNAVGLSRKQLMAQVMMEYAFLALFGALAGSLIGLAASKLFVPFFRYTGTAGVPLPPLLPVIAGNQLGTLTIVFGISIVTVEVVTIASLLHNRLTQILKRVWM